MDKIATENLFLLEFLVDKVQIDPSLTRDVGDVMGDTCVSVQFLDNAPLDICEDDFTPKRQYSRDTSNVKSGKSCLFSLTPIQAEEAIRQFDLYVDIFKKMQPGVLPDKVQIGSSLISIVNLFNELISSLSAPTGQSPTAKTLKDTFKITNATGQYIGDIGMYIRMSCFGKLIVTQFQMNLDDKSVLFKDKEGHSLYRYKKVGAKRESGGGGGGPGWDSSRNTECPQLPCPRPQSQPQTTQMTTPCNECSMMMTQSPGQSMADPGCYQEIGAQMGGNALTIRVHKDKNRLEQLDSGADVDDDTLCTCTPGNIGASKKKPKINNNRMPGGAGGCSCSTNEQNLVMRPPCADAGGASNQPFSFKMGGCGTAAQNNVTVVPPTCTAPDGTQYTELSDPNKDVFILRIGKKSEGADKKSNLELELCTPKGPDTKPPPKKETRDTQWDDADSLEASGGGAGGGAGGKGGGKGGKGGKGKGGKKKK
ncbi:hypothetical protein ILUMI_12769 [Ignelater luminosus]|uniref:Uncharacterized protein n=1 Tax=Ignelater luminosus TaxID=2038154 RepID=A0A8K0CTI8_IGNLU|nr:hypothetical protein ILUMI_12769 [Ignelater luminosus]